LLDRRVHGCALSGMDSRKLFTSAQITR
jgi:hypothetical protein